MTNRITSNLARAMKALWPGGRPLGTLTPPPISPENSTQNLPDGGKVNVMLISVIGMEATARDQMLDWMVEDCQAQGKTPVFIIDSLDLTPWIERRLLIEHLPSLTHQTGLAPDLDWDLYLKRRLLQIKRKWRSGEIADLGGKLGEIDKIVQGQTTRGDDLATKPIGRRG